MALCGTDQNKERLIKRLKRIEGQVRGLGGMISDDRDCIEVLRQIASVSGALRGVWTQMVGDHLKGCIQNASSTNGSMEELVEELIEHITKMK